MQLLLTYDTRVPEEEPSTQDDFEHMEYSTTTTSETTTTATAAPTSTDDNNDEKSSDAQWLGYLLRLCRRTLGLSDTEVDTAALLAYVRDNW